MGIFDFINESDFSVMPQYQYENQLSDIDIDNLIETWKECQQEVERLNELEKLKIEQVKYNSEQARKPLENKMKFIEDQLKIAVLNHEMKKETKTQYSVKCISGNVIVKKPQVKIKKPNIKGIEAVKIEEFKDYCEEITDVKFNWSELKKKLEIKDNQIINTETGEVLTNILEIEEEPEKVVIK